MSTDNNSPKDAAPICLQCGRAKVLTSDPAERYQCPRWTCARTRGGPPDVSKDAHKLKAAFVFLGAVENLRQAGQRALEELASDQRITNPGEVLSALHRGAENVAEAVGPVGEAINYWKNGAPLHQTSQDEDRALVLEQCATCGVWVSGPCNCSKVKP